MVINTCIVVESQGKKGSGFAVMHYSETEVALLIGPCQANLVLIAYASSEDSGEPAHLRSLARTFAAHSYKQ